MDTENKTNQTTTEKNDVYASVTQKIIADLEKGELTWRKPWSEEFCTGQVVRPLRYNDIPYSGINTLILWAAGAEHGFNSPYWMTFRQAQELYAHVQEGEKGVRIVYADKIVKEEEGANGEMQKQETTFLKEYTVFNAEQIIGLPEAFYKVPEAKIINPDTRIKGIEEFFSETKADIFSGKIAAYSETTDRIEMPPFESFVDAIGFYGILSHEMTHWTKHKSRLSRDFNKSRFGNEAYAKEELVAELGACFLAAELGFEPIPAEVHSAYIQSWLNILKHDKRFIFQAASYAQKAVEYMINLQPAKHKTTCLGMTG